MNLARVSEELDRRGYARLGPLLSGKDAAALKALFSNDERFRSHIIMRRHGVSEVRSGERYTLGIIFHDAA